MNSKLEAVTTHEVMTPPKKIYARRGSDVRLPIEISNMQAFNIEPQIERKPTQNPQPTYKIIEQEWLIEGEEGVVDWPKGTRKIC